MGQACATLGVLSGLKVWGLVCAHFLVLLVRAGLPRALGMPCYFNCLLPELGLDGASLSVCIVLPY